METREQKLNTLRAKEYYLHEALDCIQQPRVQWAKLGREMQDYLWSYYPFTNTIQEMHDVRIGNIFRHLGQRAPYAVVILESDLKAILTNCIQPQIKGLREED